MDSTVMTRTRPTSAWAAVPACAVLDVQGLPVQASNGAAHGTGLPIAGTCEQVSGLSTGAYAGVAGTVALPGVRSNEFPAPPRGAPV